MIKEHFKKIWKAIVNISVVITIIAGLMGIDGWLQDRYIRGSVGKMRIYNVKAK